MHRKSFAGTFQIRFQFQCDEGVLQNLIISFNGVAAHSGVASYSWKVDNFATLVGGNIQKPAKGTDIVSISIEEQLVSIEEKQMLQDLVTAATNDAIQKARELSKQEMAGLTGGMQIPGLGNLL